MSERFRLTVEEALSVLPDGDRIHTFIANGMLIGADWDREAVVDHITKTGGASIGGEMAMNMKHGLCLHAGRLLFCQHDPERMAALEQRIRDEAAEVSVPEGGERGE